MSRGDLTGEIQDLARRQADPGGFRDLKFYLENQFDEHGNLNMKYKRKFEWTLRRYLHEEVLTREITGIEALIRSLEPGDLRS